MAGDNDSDQMTTAQQLSPRPATRIEAIDVARGVALFAMAVYHFGWDLEFFGYVPAGMTAAGGWKLFARCIASSFLFLVGVGLFLAHGEGVRWRSFWRRWAMVAGAAAAITLATYFALSSGFIFFGILHQIALASLLGLAFLRLPVIVTLLVAVAIVAAPLFLRSPVFDHPALWWVGLSSVNPRSNDYVPLFPWFAAVLTGIAAARAASAAGLLARMAAWRPQRLWPLAFAGRHSLAVYLVHQPVLIACVWLAAQIYPAAPQSREERFMQACVAQCGQTRDNEFCPRYCACMLDALTDEGLIDPIFAGDHSPDTETRVEHQAELCTATVDGALLEGEPQ